MLDIKVDTQEEKEEQLDFPYLAQSRDNHEQIVLLLSPDRILLCSGYDDLDGKFINFMGNYVEEYKPYYGEITIKNK